MPTELPVPHASVSKEDIAPQITRILNSSTFNKSERMRTLLIYLVEQSLHGAPEKLKEYAIGVDVFKKEVSFDPRMDTTVRTEARRLRSKLDEYYRTASEDDVIEIELPKGSYGLLFHTRRRFAPPEVPASSTTSAVGRTQYARVTISAALLVVIVAAGWWYRAARINAHPKRAIRSLVVLPLLNLSGDASHQYLSDGITDALITDLAGISVLRVVSRASSMSYHSLRKTAPEIGRELGVDAVLEGSMTYQGDRIRVNAQLVVASSDEHLWAATFERQEKDVLRLESEITQAITKEIRVRILPEEQRRIQLAHAMKPEAYDAYIKGRFFISRWTQASWEKATSYFHEAVSRDPGSALAHAGLAAAYCIGSGWAMAPNECGPKCKEAAETALAIDSSLAEAHRELGGYHLFYAWNWPAAARELKTAVELNPANPISHEVYGYYFWAIGAMDEASREHRLAVQLNPVSLISNTNVGDVFYYDRRYSEAIQQYRKTLDLDPNFGLAREHLGKALVQNGRFGEAITELQTASRVERSPWTISSLGYALASASRSREALGLIDELKSQSSRRYISPLTVAVIYIGLHKPDLAIEWLEKAFQDRTDVLVWLKRDPIYDPIRARPGFQALGRRMALP